MLRTLAALALLARVSALASQRELPLELHASDAFSQLLSPDCELAPGKLIMMTEIESEYLDNGMFANWYGSAHQFLNDKVQFLFDMPDAAAVDKLRQLNYLPSDILITNKDMEVSRLNSGETVLKIDAPNGTATEDVLRRLHAAKATSDTELETETNAPWGSAEYKALMRRRPAAVLSVLEKKCTILHFDIDTVWMKSPLETLTTKSADLLITDDSLWNDRNMEKGTLCGCFLFFQPTDSIIKLAKDWITELDGKNAGHGNQKPLNHALLKNKELVKFDYLSHDEFPPGKTVRKHKHKPSKVVLYHANWVTGIEEKLAFLRNNSLWHPENAEALMQH